MQGLTDEEIDIFSDKLHQIWSNWYIYQKDNSTIENITRWNKQSNTNYYDLSEEDKEKDRKIYRKYFKKIIDKLLRQEKQKQKEIIIGKLTKLYEIEIKKYSQKYLEMISAKLNGKQQGIGYDCKKAKIIDELIEYLKN